jgi:hypothetical protein
MRRPYEVYRKYKQAQKRYFDKEVRERMSVCPGNCVFNQVVYLNDARAEVPLCTFGQHKPEEGERIETAKIVVCAKVSKAQSCPYYTPRYPTKESVAEAMAEENRDPEIRRAKYPDLEAIKWVLEKDLHNLRQVPPNLWTRFIFRIIVWLESLIKTSNNTSDLLDPPQNTDDQPS